MPRKPLLRTDLYPYHVYIRCNNKEWFDLPMEKVWTIHKKALKVAHDKFPVNIQAFVLMANHYHAVIWTPNCDLDKFMQAFNYEVSRSIRRETGRINRIFGDRYKWSLVKDKSYYNQVIKYVYQNPIKANLVNLCENYPFSTLHYICKKKPFSIPIFNPADEDDLEFFNDSFDETGRSDLTRSLSRPIFKPKRSPSSRRRVS